jgi:hypothetical protein
MICSAYLYNHIYKVKENEMGKEHGTAGRKRIIQSLMRKHGGKIHLKGRGIGGKLVLK